jgi:hypothetical protein
MEKIVSLMIFVIVFMSLLLLVAYVADVLACKFLEWLGLEGIHNEYKSTPTICFSDQDRMVEGDQFE